MYVFYYLFTLLFYFFFFFFFQAEDGIRDRDVTGVQTCALPIVAADDARFCQMESKRGIAPLGGAHFRYLTRAGWGDAMYHLFLCDEFSAARAYKIGFVQEVVAPGQQIGRAMEIANLIAKNAPIGIQVTKEAALKYIEAGEKAAIDYIPKIKDRVFSSEDMKEGIQSFVERRSAVFRGK